MDDPPPIRYRLRDDEHPHFVRFASLLEVAVGYDSPNAAIEFQQDHGPSNDHLQGRNMRNTRRMTQESWLEPPRAIPMWGPIRAMPVIPMALPPVPLPLLPPFCPPPHPSLTLPAVTTHHATLAPPTTTTTTATQLEPIVLHQQHLAHTEATPHAAPRPPKPTHVTITTYNVVSARGTRLLGALRAMADLNTDIAVLTETKLCGGRHAKQGFGYSVFATSAVSPHQGGVALVWRTKPAHWILEGVRTLSANSLSAILVSGTKRWLLLGTYLSPNEDPESELGILEVEGQRHPNVPVILMGDLNADLNDNANLRSIAITTTIQHLGAVDIFHRFIQKKKRRNTRHRRLSDGSEQRSRCDYALVDPSIDVCSIRIVIPPRFHSDHRAVKLQLRSSTPQDHRRYVHNRSQLPHVRPKPDEKGPNRKFEELLKHRVPIPRLHTHPEMHGLPMTPGR